MWRRLSITHEPRPERRRRRPLPRRERGPGGGGRDPRPGFRRGRLDPDRDGESRRDLPVRRAAIPASEELAMIVIDGYVDLDPAGRPGLGAHVHTEYGVPVIGVAKTPFATATPATQVLV